MEISSLAWSREKQLALCGHLILDDEFARGTGSAVMPEWFGAETALVKCRSLQLAFIKDFGRLPSLDELREGPGMRSESQDVRDLVARAVSMSVEAARRWGLDALSQEVRHWHKDLLFKDGVHKAVALYKLAKPEEAFQTVEHMISQVRDADAEQDRRLRWENYEEHFRKRIEEYSGALSWGDDLFDRKLMPESEHGCMVPGQSTILLSGTNRGKSRCLCSVVRHNFLRGKAILWIVHEDPEVDVEMNLWCAILQLNRGQLLEFQRTAEGRAAMNQLVPLLREFVEFAWMPPTKYPIEDVVASIRRRQAARIAKYGRGFDLLVNDYPKKLHSRTMHGDVRHVISYIYGQFMGLALEYGFHALLAFQTNREGHKASMVGGKRLCDGCRRNPVGERWILEGDAGEAFDPIQDTCNVISLNRNRAMEEAGITVFYFCKTKASQAKGWAIACRGRYDWALTHGGGLASTCFSSETMVSTKTLVSWLDTYSGQAVPMHLVEAV